MDVKNISTFTFMESMLMGGSLIRFSKVVLSEFLENKSPNVTISSGVELTSKLVF